MAPVKPWQQDAVDAYTPFKAITKADGSVTPHSLPNVLDGGYQIKLGAGHPAGNVQAGRTAAGRLLADDGSR